MLELSKLKEDQTGDTASTAEWAYNGFQVKLGPSHISYLKRVSAV